MALTVSAPRTYYDFTGANKKAESYFDVSDGRTLLLATKKSLRGGLSTFAIVGRMDSTSGVAFFRYFMMSDFSREVINRMVRVTGKALEKQHDDGLSLVDALLDEIAAYYSRGCA